MAKSQKHILFDEQDIKSIEAIRLRYGLDTLSQAVRMAVRLAAVQPRQKNVPVPAPRKHAVKKEPRKLGNALQAYSLNITPDQFRATHDELFLKRREHLLTKFSPEATHS